jgi:hypothetical protein
MIKKEENLPNIVNTKINRMICSSNGDSIFKGNKLLFYQRNNNILVLIDGVEWNGVKLVSISPQNSHVTTFPVQTFTNLYSKLFFKIYSIFSWIS